MRVLEELWPFLPAASGSMHALEELTRVLEKLWPFLPAAAAPILGYLVFAGLVLFATWVGLVYILPYGVHILGAVLASIGSILPSRAGHEPKKSTIKIFGTQVTWDGRANSGLFIVGVCLILYSAVVAYRAPSNPPPEKIDSPSNKH